MEMDLNFDDISIVACESKTMWPEKPMGEMGGMMERATDG